MESAEPHAAIRDGAAAPATEAPKPAPTSLAASEGCSPLQLAKVEPLADHIDAAIPELQDFTESNQMDAFYRKLAALARGRRKERVRIGVWGDSNMTRDFITGELRRVLQRQFGDGGHGFVALGKPWNWYRHEDVKHGSDDGWESMNMSTKQTVDRLYGVGGVAAQSVRTNARVWVATAEAGAAVGTRAGHFEILYLKHPRHGQFEVLIDGQSRATIDTAGDAITAAQAEWDVSDGAHRIDFVSRKSPVRLLGAVLETSTPGIVVDSLGIGGVNTELIARGDEALTAQTLRMRNYDLMMLLTGATEPDAPSHDDGIRRLVANVRRELPNVPFVMMSPPDLAGGDLAHPTRVRRMNQIERRKLKAARELKLLYWDFRGAMGGEQSIVRFTEHKMAWKDFIHLTGKGGHAMGRRLAIAVLNGFQSWLAAHPSDACGDN